MWPTTSQPITEQSYIHSNTELPYFECDIYTKYYNTKHFNLVILPLNEIFSNNNLSVHSIHITQQRRHIQCSCSRCCYSSCPRSYQRDSHWANTSSLFYCLNQCTAPKLTVNITNNGFQLFTHISFNQGIHTVHSHSMTENSIFWHDMLLWLLCATDIDASMTSTPAWHQSLSS